MSGSHLYYRDANNQFVPVSADAPLPVNVNPSLGDSTVDLTITDVTDASNIAAGARWLSVTNTGGSDGTFAGVTLAAGATETIVAPTGFSLGAIAYDATGTTFRIRTLT